MATRDVAGARSTNQMVGYVFGAVYVLIGIVGFFLTGFDGFTAQEGPELVAFQINPLHNIVHLLIGVALLVAASRGASSARAMNMTIGIAYAGVGVLGFLIQDSSANILALNTADHFLHLGSAAVLLGVALGADREARGTAR